MYTYEANIVWKGAKAQDITARENPVLCAATPPEFGGPPRCWSPLELLVAAIGGCLLSTYLNIAEKRGVTMKSYDSQAKGTVEETPDGLRFTQVDVTVIVVVDSDIMAKKALALREPVEKKCPVSAGMNFPVNLELNVQVAK